MLDGSFTVRVDDKGRIKLPSEFRRQMVERFGDEAFYVTSVRGDCAHVYPSRAWEQILETLSSQPPSRGPVRKFLRYTGYYGQMATPDPQGRLLIHPRLREAAGIEDEVLILGQKNHLEVWNLKKFKETILVEPVTAADEDYLATLGL